MSDTDCRLNPEADWATIRQLRADLATAETGLKDAQWRLGEVRIQLATVTAELKERASMGSLQDMAAKLNDAEHNLAIVTAERDADRAQHIEIRVHQYATALRVLESERLEHAETRKALEEAKAVEVALHDGFTASATALESTRAALARSEARVKELGHRSTLDHEVLAALSRVPDITLSEDSCTPGLHWEPVRKAERARRRG